MDDKNNNNVISLFNSLHNAHGENCKADVCFAKNGIPYVKAEHDKNGNEFDVQHLIKDTKECKYVIRVLEIEHKPVIYSFLVSGDKLLEFLSGYIDNEKDGKIIEIERYYANSPA